MSSRRVSLDKRKRTETSCDVCKSRKQKCDRQSNQEQCRYCQAHALRCTATQPRKKRLYGSFEGLGTRIEMLESLVKALLPQANTSSLDELRRLGTSLGIPLPAVGEHPAEEAHALLQPPDQSCLLEQQGQVQYMGPNSSFAFHMKLRNLFEDFSVHEYQLFAPNAAEAAGPGQGTMHASPSPSSKSVITPLPSEGGSSSASEELDLDIQAYDDLLDAFFRNVHPHYPCVHERSFRATYEVWSRAPSSKQRIWLCTLLAMMLLASRTCPDVVSEEQEHQWWRDIQTLLPTVVFSSTIGAIQALMLIALHLHHNNHRDAAWSLTGMSVRVAHSIGLHRDEFDTKYSAVETGLRKHLWHSLFLFEQMQVSSYDRPSAIDYSSCSATPPDESLVADGAYYAPEYMAWAAKLTPLLAQACRARSAFHKGSPEVHFGPFSPASKILRDLEKWMQTLPTHLQAESLEKIPPNFYRSTIMLHVRFHYIVMVLTRSALLQRASLLLQGGPSSIDRGTLSVSNTCIKHSRLLSYLMQKVDAVGKYDVITAFDILFSLNGAMTLSLDVMCSSKETGLQSASYPMGLLRGLAELTHRHMTQPRIPITLRVLATTIPVLYNMARRYLSGERPHMVQAAKQALNGPPLQQYNALAGTVPIDVNGFAHVPQAPPLVPGYVPHGYTSIPVPPYPTYADGSEQWTETPVADLNPFMVMPSEWQWDNLGAFPEI